MIAIAIIALSFLTVHAQSSDTSFRAYLVNKEYDIYLHIDFYSQNITVPGQELYGELPGYLRKRLNSFCWVITSCQVLSDKKAEFQLINDFGSEDLQATLTRENDSLYILRQEKGSTIKIPKNGKWQKLPKTIELIRR